MGAEVWAELGKNEFTHSAVYNEATDCLTVLEKECGYVARYMSGSNIELLFDGQEQDKLVGVKINQYSQMVSSEVLEAHKK